MNSSNVGLISNADNALITNNSIKDSIAILQNIINNFDQISKASNKNEILQSIVENIKSLLSIINTTLYLKPFINIFVKIQKLFDKFCINSNLLSDDIYVFIQKIFQVINELLYAIQLGHNISEDKIMTIEASFNKVYDIVDKKFNKTSAKLQSIKSTSFIKINTDRIEDILNIAEELIVLKGQIFEKISWNEHSGFEFKDLFDKTTKELYNKILSVRMTSLKYLF